MTKEENVIRKTVGICMGLWLLAAPFAAPQQTSNEELKREIEALRKRLMELETKLEKPAAKQDIQAGHATKWKVSGYVMGQYTHTENTAEGAKNDDQFKVRRARLKVDASLNRSSSFLLQMDATSKESKVSLKDASFSYQLPNGPKLTVGQRKWNWGFESLQSSSYRLLPERTIVNHKFFPGERDRGLYFEGATKTEKPLYWSAGIWNGNGVGDKDFTKNDPNDEKDICLRLSNLHGYKYHGPAGQFNWQLSGYFGKAHGFDATGAERDFTKRRYGAACQYFYEAVPEENTYDFREGSAIRVELQIGKGWVGSALKSPPLAAGHAAIGKHQWMNANANGGYVEISKILDPKWDLVGRYQIFDPDNAAKQKSVGIGFIHYLDEQSKLTLAYEAPNTAAGGSDTVTVRFQHKY